MDLEDATLREQVGHQCALVSTGRDDDVVSLDRPLRGLGAKAVVVSSQRRDLDTAADGRCYKGGIPPLPEADEPKLSAGKMLVTGWGSTQQGGPAVRTLREVAVPFVSQADCSDPLRYGKRITDRMLCAGEAEGGADACQGDSGGPLATARSGAAARLVGVVSWGEGCAKPGKPGVYARVPVLNSWLEACMASSDAC